MYQIRTFYTVLDIFITLCIHNARYVCRDGSIGYLGQSILVLDARVSTGKARRISTEVK